jgi:NAD+ synthase (glutamine-hydrolysing)
MTLRFAVAQCNFVVGDLNGNAQRIIEAAQQAHAQGVDVLLTPELALAGYAAEDLYLRPAFLADCAHAVQQVAAACAELEGLHVVLGHPWAMEQASNPGGRSTGGPLAHNAATVWHAGQCVARYAKQCLPNYQVFDERRYFAPGGAPCVFAVRGHRVGVLICEDAWYPEPAQQAKQQGAQVLAVLNASPYHVGKSAEREAVMAQRALGLGLPLAYAHLVGGQDEVVFEGRSFAVDSHGQVAARAPGFVEALPVWRLDVAAGQWQGTVAPLEDAQADLWRALALGLYDYVQKNRFPSVLLGLSGGIDSALVLALAVDALGADRVHAVMMPSPYTADISLIDARDMASRLGVRYHECPVAPTFDALRQTLAPVFEGAAEDTTEENLQARVRGNLLMAISNKFGALVLTTGNKSELATGYCTLYGDMAGGFALIKDVVKTQVYALARWRNQHNPMGGVAQPIPQRIIERAPSAELRPDQTDQDSLPAYDVLDAILQAYIEQEQTPHDIVAQGQDPEVVQRVLHLLRASEYKRRQGAIGVRVTHRAFGRDWRYPITQGYRHRGPQASAA